MNKQGMCSLKMRQDKVEQGKVREKATVSRIQAALKKEERLNFQNNLTILFSYLIVQCRKGKDERFSFCSFECYGSEQPVYFIFTESLCLLGVLAS